MKLKIKNARLSFPSLFRKAVFNGQETKFEATFLIPKESEMAQQIEKGVEDFVQEKFNGKPPKGLKLTCLGDGDSKDYDGYAGMLALKAGSQRRPLLIDSDKTPLSEEDNRLYAGCYVNAQVDFWYSDHSLGGKQVLATLYGVQFAKNGKPFGTGSAATVDDFDEIEDDDDSEF